MKPEEIHRKWAPDGEPWSPWVKPVLFAALGLHGRTQGRPQVVDLPPAFAWVETDLLRPLVNASKTIPGHPYREGAARDTAIVVDLPGRSGAELGIALAILGYRPIPLYNALPGPRAIVDLGPIMDVLVDGANTVDAVPLCAPPAFLLDANRLGEGSRFLDGGFDNRSICVTSDFPSAETLQRAGIRSVVVVVESAPLDDLDDALRIWQANGIELWFKRTNDDLPAAVATLRAPNFVKRIMRTVQRRFLHRRTDGSFGQFIRPSSG